MSGVTVAIEVDDAFVEAVDRDLLERAARAAVECPSPPAPLPRAGDGGRGGPSPPAPLPGGERGGGASPLAPLLRGERGGRGGRRRGRRVELGLSVVGDEEIRRLNAEYRGLDEPTDVLSFALTETAEAAGGVLFVLPPDGVVHLGEVVVSYPRAVAQAQAGGHPVEQELALLVVHGVLHLLGHDHAEPEEAAAMHACEVAVLARIGLPRPGSPMS
ncbi:MAG: rRNA maturation RNase YbeY [Chloroflexi bacterium]|nr:rRNA maturation RNase YbeY [Chloroflexota bacterium]